MDITTDRDYCPKRPSANSTENSYEDEENNSYEYSDDEFSGDRYVHRVPLFDGTARIVARARLPAKRFDISAEITVACGRGALLSASGSKDYLWLGFVEEKAGLKWNAGSGTFVLNVGKVVYDGRSKVSARRYRKDGVLRYGSATVRGTAPGRMNSLNLDPYIYIGNPPENVTMLVLDFLLFLKNSSQAFDSAPVHCQFRENAWNGIDC